MHMPNNDIMLYDMIGSGIINAGFSHRGEKS